MSKGVTKGVIDDVDCKACRAGLPLVWCVQSRRTVHLRGLATFSCKRMEAHERRQRDVVSDRGNADGRGR